MSKEMEQFGYYQNGYPNMTIDNSLYEAECMLIGAVFLEPSLIHELILEPFHFSQKRNQLVFKTMKKLQSLGKPIDYVLMAEALGDNIESIGGIKFLTDIAVHCPTTSNIEHYQDIVIESYKIRILRQAAEKFLLDQSLERAEDFYQSYIHIQEVGITKLSNKKEILFQMYEEIFEDQGEMAGIDSGFKDLNAMLNGLQKSDLIIIAARPSVGKTAFALNLAMNCCRKNGVVDFFSLEMPEKQLAKRMLSDISNIDGYKWKNPYRYFSEVDQKRATNALGVYDGWKMNIHDAPRQTITDIRALIQKTKRENPNKEQLVIIDYLQLITQTKKFDRHDLAIGHITRELKQIARQYEVPIVLLSQLSRGVEHRVDKLPKMSDLRDSGSIEQDADVIMLLSREEWETSIQSNHEIIIVDIAKQRNGPTGTIKLLFEKSFSRFRDLMEPSTYKA